MLPAGVLAKARGLWEQVRIKGFGTIHELPTLLCLPALHWQSVFRLAGAFLVRPTLHQSVVFTPRLVLAGMPLNPRITGFVPYLFLRCPRPFTLARPP